MMKDLVMSDRMRRGEKLIFGWGDVFGGGAQALIAVIYLIYLTDVIGMNPAIGAMAILISKVWDAISDPLMGVVSDNTRTSIGRRRPYILVGGLLVVIAFSLLWMPTTTWASDVLKAIFAVATFMLYSTVATVVIVPYSSLSAEITTNMRERNSVNVIRLAVSTSATAVCSLVPSLILEAYKGGSIDLTQFYLLIGIGFGSFFALPLVLIGLFTRERAPVPEVRSVFKLETFVKPLKVKVFRGLIRMYLCQSIAQDILATGIIYYAIYVAKGSPTAFLGVFIGGQLMMFPLIYRLVDVWDKRRIYYLGLPLTFISIIGLGIYPADWNVIGAYVLTWLASVGFAGAQFMSWVIFPDVVDVGELKFGERTTGSYSGIMTFVRKVASAVAIQVFGVMLALSGYIRATSEVPIPEQPNSAVLGIRIALGGSFALLLLAGHIAARRFPLTKKKSAQVSYLLRLKGQKAQALWNEEERRAYATVQDELF